MVWRYLAGGAAALAMAGAGVLVFSGHARPDPVLPAAPAVAQSAGADAMPLPDTVPEASARTREEKRFGRYDKDKSGEISREEYLANRRKAYARLDTNHDGQLSFDEWSAKTIAKFAAADRDHSNAMTPAEFATTAVKRKPRAPCAPSAAATREEDS